MQPRARDRNRPERGARSASVALSDLPHDLDHLGPVAFCIDRICDLLAGVAERELRRLQPEPSKARSRRCGGVAAGGSGGPCAMRRARPAAFRPRGDRANCRRSRHRASPGAEARERPVAGVLDRAVVRAGRATIARSAPRVLPADRARFVALARRRRTLRMQPQAALGIRLGRAEQVRARRSIVHERPDDLLRLRPEIDDTLVRAVGVPVRLGLVGPDAELVVQLDVARPHAE